MKTIQNKFLIELTSWEVALIFEALIRYDVGCGTYSSFRQGDVEDVCSDFEKLMKTHEPING